jgi:hypothetical protein
MKFLRPALVVALALACAGAGVAFGRSRAWSPVSSSAAKPPAPAAPVAAALADSAGLLAQALHLAAPDLDRAVLDLALEAQAGAMRRGLVRDSSTLTVIDYSRPSVEPRFFVLDLAARKLVFEELVAHGKNSGDNLAQRFSNTEASLETSLGLFVTCAPYVGEHGRSLRLAGLEPGFNDRAEARGIVIHGADYVSLATAAKLGRLGRSWGCPALPPGEVQKVIDRIQGGSAVFAYYPDARWLGASRFLAAGQRMAAITP